MADPEPPSDKEGALDRVKEIVTNQAPFSKKKRKKRSGLLRKKFHTTPLIQPAERPAVTEEPIRKVSVFRIVWILFKIPRLIWRGLYFKFSGKMTSKEMARELRGFLESMGGMWIKVGQVLSLRSDVFSLDFCNELSLLQDHTNTFSSERSMEIVEESLQRPIADVFDSFEVKPFAAASLSQAHKARLRGRESWVVVKVQRPYANDYFRYDFWWLSRYFGLLTFFDIMSHMHWPDMLSQVRHMMTEELDYRREAAEMKQFRRTLRRDSVYVPRVYQKLTTRRVIVMEFLDGVFMSDYIKMHRTDPQRLAAWREENDIKPKKVASVLFRSLLRQIYEDRTFHGDLHPGNIVLLRKSRIAFIDFGNTGTFDRDFAKQYELYSIAVATGSFSRAADLYLLMLGKLPVLDIHRVKMDLMAAMERQEVRGRIKNLPFHEKSLSAGTAEANAIVTKLKLEPNWNLLKIARTFAAVDMNIGELNPKINYFKEMGAYHAQAQRRKLRFPDLAGLVTRISDFSGIIFPSLLRRTMVFAGRVSNAARVGAFVLRLLSRALWVGLFGIFWLSLYQNHNQLVRRFHPTSGWLTRFIEGLPILPDIVWWLIIVFLIVCNVRFGRFVRDITTPPDRLPGDSS
jgi:ubiquinone biosynthesis protein